MDAERLSGINQCKSCGASIRWIRTTDDKPMPVEANAEVRVTEQGRVVRLYVPHWASCPGAKEHRKSRVSIPGLDLGAPK